MSNFSIESSAGALVQTVPLKPEYGPYRGIYTSTE